MQRNIVIAIGREAGSGGKLIGQMLAEDLGIKCYDRELLELAAKNSGMSKEIFEAHEEKPTGSFLYNLVMDTYSMGYTTAGYGDMPISHKVFLAQFDAIKKLAAQESCVIVGRCADYALEDYPNAIRVFITGKEADQLKRLSEYYKIPLAKAKDLRKKINKHRSNYYNYYTGKKWGGTDSYDLCFNSSVTGYSGAVELIKTFMKIKGL